MSEDLGRLVFFGGLGLLLLGALLAMAAVFVSPATHPRLREGVRIIAGLCLLDGVLWVIGLIAREQGLWLVIALGVLGAVITVVMIRKVLALRQAAPARST